MRARVGDETEVNYSVTVADGCPEVLGDLHERKIYDGITVVNSARPLRATGAYDKTTRGLKRARSLQ